MTPEELDPTFARNLRLLREQKNWSQRHLAELLSTSASVIVDWEKGIKSPTLKTVSKLCRVLGVTPNTLLGESISEILEAVPA